MSEENVIEEQLDKDIRNTDMEAIAYHKLAEGFGILSRLPENEGAQATMFGFQMTKYEASEAECRRFLGKLYAIREKRQKTAAALRSK